MLTHFLIYQRFTFISFDLAAWCKGTLSHKSALYKFVVPGRLSKSMASIVNCSFSTAIWTQVFMSKSVAFTSAPSLRRTLAEPTCPAATAFRNGVRPSSSCVFTLAPFSTRSEISLVWLNWAALETNVQRTKMLVRLTWVTKAIRGLVQFCLWMRFVYCKVPPRNIPESKVRRQSKSTIGLFGVWCYQIFSGLTWLT